MRSVTQPTRPQLVIATDIWKPPGVTMRRKGDCATIALDGVEQGPVDRQRAAAQQHRAVAELLPGIEGEQVGHQGINMAARFRIPIR